MSTARGPPIARSDRDRFSAKRKRKAVLRHLRDEELDVVSREQGANDSTLSKWPQSFFEGRLGALRSRAWDEREERIRELKRTLGQVTMNNELPYENSDRMEGGVPQGRRRLKR